MKANFKRVIFSIVFLVFFIEMQAQEYVWLSDLEYAPSSYSGWLGIQIDKNSDGSSGPLWLGTTKVDSLTYDKFVSSSATSLLVYGLDKKYGRFITDIGPNMLSGPSIKISVIVDGVTKFQSDEITNVSPIQHLDINVAGADSIKIFADDLGDASGDWVSLGGAKLELFSPLPTVNSVTDSNVFSNAGAQTINLSNITSKGTALSIVPTFTGDDVIQDLSVNYTFPANTAIFSFTPKTGTSGIAIVNLKLTDNQSPAPFSREITFKITVIDPNQNFAPTINPINNLVLVKSAGQQTINLSGITNGDPNKPAQKVISVTATSSNPSLIPDPVVNYSDPSTTGTLVLSPAGTIGDVTITVTITDDGATGGNNVNTKEIQFNVSIVDPSYFGAIFDFSGNSAEGWNGGASTVTVQNQMVNINPVKTNLWDAFDFAFPALDITSNPYVSLKIKSNFDLNLSFAIGNAPDKIDGYPSGIQVIDGTSSQEIVAGDVFQTYSFDFSGTKGVDMTKVNNLHFLVNPLYVDLGPVPNKLINFDDIKIGIFADHTPAISNIQDQVFTVKETDSEARTVKFRNVTDGSTDNNKITIAATSSNTGLVPAPVVNYTSPDRTGSLVIKPNDNVIGESVISVNVSAPNTNADKVMTFKVKVVPNAAPAMESIKDMLVQKGKKVSLPLEKITDGNPESIQSVNITALSSDASLISGISVTHNPLDFNGTLAFMPSASAAPGSSATISIKLKDDGGILQSGVDSAKYTFKVTIYNDVNHAPTLDSIPSKGASAIASNFDVLLSGIGNSDNGGETLSFETWASNNEIVNSVSVGPVSNGNATLVLGRTGQIGSDTIWVKITDNGGNAGNNGNLSVTRHFVLTTYPSSLTGAILDYSIYSGNASESGIINDKNNGTVDIASDGTVHIAGTTKSFTFPSVYFTLGNFTGGKKIDMSANKHVSFKIKVASTNWNVTSNIKNDVSNIDFRLLDTKGPGSSGSGYGISNVAISIPSDDQWHDFYLDYSNLFYKDADGGQTDSTQITKLMLDIDDTWFNEIRGDYYFKDIRVGDKAIKSGPTKYTIDPVMAQVTEMDKNPKPVLLSGISDGAGILSGKLTATTDKSSFITSIKVSSVLDGKAQLTYLMNTSKADNANIVVIASNPDNANILADTISFKVFLTDTVSSGKSSVTLNLSHEYQTMAGLGCMLGDGTDPNLVDNAKKLNISLMRFTNKGDFEPVNDNSDPNVISWDGFNLNALPLDQIRSLNENTNCHRFFFTPWTPPTWMKVNKAAYPPNESLGWVTNNRLMPTMYDEYAEYLVAIIKAVKEGAGVELYAISIQNEPTFNEPYVSCQYDGNEFKEFIKVLGAKIESEGLNTKIMMPEDVALNNWPEDKINAVTSDPTAKGFIGIVAVHNYDPTGINPGNVGPDNWTQMKNLAATTPAEGLWMTETSGFTNVWEGYWGKDYLSGNPVFFPGPFEFAGVMYNAFKFGHIAGWTDLETIGGKVNLDLLGSVFRNFSGFVNPGSIMVDAVSDNTDILSLAFKNTDGSVTSILLNRTQGPKKVALKGIGVPKAYRSFTTESDGPFVENNVITNGEIVLPARSITTLVSSSGNLPPTIDQVANQNLVLANGEKTIDVTGITDGELIASQIVTASIKSDHPSIATATIDYLSGSTGKVNIVPKQLGSTVITIVLKDNGGIENFGVDSTVMKFAVDIVLVDGIPTLNDKAFNIFPNPVNDMLNVNLPSSNCTISQIVDLSGRTVYSEKLGTGQIMQAISTKNLKSGYYILIVTDNEGIHRRQFIKR